MLMMHACRTRQIMSLSMARTTSAVAKPCKMDMHVIVRPRLSDRNAILPSTLTARITASDELRIVSLRVPPVAHRA